MSTCPPVYLSIILDAVISLKSIDQPRLLSVLLSAWLPVYQPEYLSISLNPCLAAWLAPRAWVAGCRGLNKQATRGRITRYLGWLSELHSYFTFQDTLLKFPFLLLYEIVYIFLQDFNFFFYLCRPSESRPHYCPLPGWQPTQAMVESAMVWASNLGLL
jgi:hypothetical protein